MQQELVPQIGQQIADQWEALSAELQTPNMPGCLTTPAISINTAQLLNKLESGILRITMPLKPGAIKIKGVWQTVKSDCYVEANLAVKSGYVVLEDTHLSVWRCKTGGQGSDQAVFAKRSGLNGPLAPIPGLRPLAGFKGVKFDQSGNLKLRLSGLNWNLNNFIKLPKDRPLAAGELITCLLANAEIPEEQEIAAPKSYTLTPALNGPHVLDGQFHLTAQRSRRLTADSVGNVEVEPGADEGASNDGSTGPLPTDCIDWDNMRVSFTGEFAAGDLPVGPESFLSLAPGTRVTIDEANPSALSLKFSANLNMCQFIANDTQWQCGQGSANFELYLESPAPLETPDRVTIRFSTLDLHGVSLLVPANMEDEQARPLTHQIHIAALKIIGALDDTPPMNKPVIVYDNTAARANASDLSGEPPATTCLQLDLPQVRLEQASVLLHILGAGQGKGRMQMGLGDGAWARAPMTIDASIALESSPADFAFSVSGQIESGRVDLVSSEQDRQSHLGLISSRNLSVLAHAVRLQGTGGFGFHQNAAAPAHLYIASEVNEHPWQVVIEDYDARLQDPRQGLLVDVYDRASYSESGKGSISSDSVSDSDSSISRSNMAGVSVNSETVRRDVLSVSSESSIPPRSQLAVRALAFGGADMALPSFDASGVLAVTLGGLQYRGAQSEQNLNLQGGSHGELIIRQADRKSVV